jgi:hypothetical protein
VLEALPIAAAQSPLDVREVTRAVDRQLRSSVVMRE